MKKLFCLLAPLPLLLSTSVQADSLSGARHLLCSTLSSDICLQDEGCMAVHVTDLNIPRFIKVDTRTGKLATTQASGENRETTAASTARDDGQIILQGVEQGRAFSLYVNEANGDATFVSASDGASVTVFAACTPADR